MWNKPSILSRLSIQDILKYWSMLTIEQRNEFLSTRAALLLGEQANGLVAPSPRSATVDSIFERFAGVFHAFECLRDGVLTALKQDNEKEALYRVFGAKHDSLGSLLQRVREDAERDLVDRYLITMCARQLCNELGREFRDFWRAHDKESKRVESLANDLATELRQSLRNTDASMESFLPWFEERFLARATKAVAP